MTPSSVPHGDWTRTLSPTLGATSSTHFLCFVAPACRRNFWLSGLTFIKYIIAKGMGITNSAHKNVILSLVERGGEVRSYHVAGSATNEVIPVVTANIAIGQFLQKQAETPTQTSPPGRTN